MVGSHAAFEPEKVVFHPATMLWHRVSTKMRHLYENELEMRRQPGWYHGSAMYILLSSLSCASRKGESFFIGQVEFGLIRQLSKLVGENERW